MKVFVVSVATYNPRDDIDNACPHVFKTREGARKFVEEEYNKLANRSDSWNYESDNNYDWAQVINTDDEVREWEIFEVEIEG